MSDGQESLPTEKTPRRIDLDDAGAADGYVLDARLYKHELGASDTAELKTASDGSTILIPQPSSDPNDPLNWSQLKKHAFLFIISATAFLPDYGSSTGAVTLLPQSKQWHLPITTVNHALVGNLFMLGAGGLFVVALSSYFGRLPVLVWFLCFSLGTAAWCAAATSFESFMTARILNGFFSTVAQAGGLMFIKDMFFFHELIRKINIWSSFIILSPYLGPLVAAFITWKTRWPWAYWVITILNAICLILVLAIMDETYYNRNLAPDQQPRRKSRLLRLIGIEQWKSRRQRGTFFQSLMRPVIAISKLPVFLTSLYYVFTFAWVIGLNATTSVFLEEVYHFGLKQTGLYFFAPIVATILGEILGHWLHDFTAKIYTKRHGGRFEPEARLIPIWVSTPCMVLGIIFLGFSLEREWHYMVTAVVWGLYVFGIMISTTAINGYLLDAYPEAPGEVAAWINFGRTVGGFIITYYEIKWTTSEGTEKSLGIQAAIVAAAFGIIILLQIYGKSMRRWQGRMIFPVN